jgi:hypothetical protein
MNVFLSHSIQDKQLILKMKGHCLSNGINLLVAEHSISLDKSITEKIKIMIQQSHVVVFLLTKNDFNSKFVQQEIGYVESLKKARLFIVEKGQQKEITGFHYGYDYIELDPLTPDIAIQKAIGRLLIHWRKVFQIQEKQKKEAALFITGIIGLALLFNSG